MAEEKSEEKSLSPEQERKLALQAEMAMRKILFATSNTPYKKEYKVVKDKKGNDKIEVANPIEIDSPFHNKGMSTRQIRRGNERVDFTLFGNHIETHFTRKNSNGKWIT